MVKFGGESYNKSPVSKRGITTSFKCSVCGRIYKQAWSKDNHEKLCKEKNLK